PQAWPLTAALGSHRILVIRSREPMPVVAVTTLLQAWPLPWVIAALRREGHTVNQVVIPSWEGP
ncbi:MAG: hypothetical protein KC613_24920, partial [Myxococcales bacterium]|nr:hypothetical protein [Myxococcales bacterium]